MDISDILKSIKRKIGPKPYKKYKDNRYRKVLKINKSISIIKSDSKKNNKINNNKTNDKNNKINNIINKNNKNNNKNNNTAINNPNNSLPNKALYNTTNNKITENNGSIKLKGEIMSHNHHNHHHDLNNPKLYINRELSWLEFNRRVLEESEDETNPLLERMKFIAIFHSNLDEFFMIRVAGLKQRVYAKMMEPSFDGLTPLEQLEKIYEKTTELLKSVEKNYNKIVDELSKHGIHIHDFKKVDGELKHKGNKYFEEHILPVLTPLAVDAAHPYPHVVNLGFNILLKIKDDDGIKLGLVPIPKNIPRFIKIDLNDDKLHYVLLEDLIIENLHHLFPNKKIVNIMIYRLTRDADIRIQEDEADDLLEEIEKGLKERRFGKAVRLEVNGDSQYLLHFLMDEYDLGEKDVYKLNIPLNLTDLWQLYGELDFPELRYPPYTPYLSPIFEIDLFTLLKKKDVVLFHPYDSFEPVVDLLNEAVDDPNVLAVKMILYRVGKNSPIVDALRRMAANGKEVTTVIELKARFDEESNISWAKFLEETGAHVVYGIPKMKIHAKLLMIVRKEGDKIKRYVHTSTGNYNYSTVKIYSDVGYMTSDETIGKDVEKIFNAITGYFQHPDLKKLSISPHRLKERIIKCIKREMEYGKEGKIIAKMNSLVDVDVIKELYKASQKGVDIKLIVRGICCLRPNIEGISDNIHVRSIVGKYLEHARIFYFRNGGGDNEEVYISSADWMPRNFNKRVETLVPIENPKIKEYLKEILHIQLKDTAKARILQSDGSYIRPEKRDFNSQEYFEKLVREVDINNTP